MDGARLDNCIEASTYRNSGSVAIGGVIPIGISLLLVFANYGFPRLVFRPLGLAYLECQDGSVYLSSDGAEKISRITADAFPKNLVYPVRIARRSDPFHRSAPSHYWRRS